MASDSVATHYASGGLAEKIASGLRHAGKVPGYLTTADLAPYDEFHFGGRRATLELAAQMRLDDASRVLDIGSGLGGPARTLAGEYGCHVTGIDLTQEFCEVATTLSDWVDLGDRIRFRQGDATDLPFAADTFDAAMTIHVAMNIPDKDKVYQEARRVVRPGGIFAVYDILRGEGGEIEFPVPWATESAHSHLATPDEMRALLTGAGFGIVAVHDSSDESLAALGAAMAQADAAEVASPTQLLFGGNFKEMTRNQFRGLEQRRIRTVSYICRA